MSGIPKWTGESTGLIRVDALEDSFSLLCSALSLLPDKGCEAPPTTKWQDCTVTSSGDFAHHHSVTIAGKSLADERFLISAESFLILFTLSGLPGSITVAASILSGFCWAIAALESNRTELNVSV